jgi:polyisoprenoid-binding protein YceI
MKKMVIAIVAGAAVLAGAGSGARAADTYILDVDHTNVLFFVNHLGFSTMEGEFDDVQGRFVFDQEDVTKSTVEVTIQAASVDTDVEALDDHLRGPDFFDVKQFPEITFKSRKIEKTGDNTGRMTGDLTLHGVTGSVVLDIKFNRAGVHPTTKNFVAGFSATTSLKRSDYGIVYGTPYVGDQVDIRLEIEGLRQDTKDKQ